MVRKNYLPFILLIAAVILLLWIKSNQRGGGSNLPDRNTSETSDFKRSGTKIVYSKHARCRMDCRHIDGAEVADILANGNVNYSKVEEDAKGKTYPVEGITRDKQNVRIVFAPHGNETVVVTVIDLDKDWPCNCN